MAPPSRNTYLEYKRNTGRLIKWVVTTAEAIPEKPSLVSLPGQAPPTPPVSPKRNFHAKGKRKKQPDSVISDPASPTSPEINATKLIQLSRDISSSTEFAKPIPPTIYSLFESVIKYRTAAYNFWLDIEAANPSDETKRSNQGHKGFIDALQTAFEILGGVEWQTKRAEEKEEKLKGSQASKSSTALRMEELEVENRFGGLEIDDIPSGDESVASKQEQWLKGLIPDQNSGRGGGSRKSKASRKVEKQFRGWEDYNVKSESEASFAGFCFMKDMFDLRSYIAGIWQEVADDKLNIAVAGALSNLAAGMVKQLQFEIAADFPQCSNFEAIIELLLGTVEFKSTADSTNISPIRVDGVPEKHHPAFNSLDIYESCLIGAYRDLVTFITDYRKGRNCRPTPRVASFRWNPDLDLYTLSENERRKWRSNFCVMWLYDMVNQFASTRLTADKQEQPLETVDWKSSKFGRRVLFGPTKFCGEVTALAMALKTSPLIEEIQPHMVFQVQVMLDSMTIFRGWHFEIPPALTPARTFIGPDVPFELGRHMEDMEAFKETFLMGAEKLLDEFKQTDPVRWEFPLKNIPPLVSEVGIVLGDSLLSRLTHRDFQSRFLETNRNGLWVYCPWICGVGLAQALNVVFDWGRVLWDNSGIPLPMFHFYNLMLESGYLKKGPMPLFEDLLKLFGDQVFRGGKRPKKEFFKCWNTSSGVKAQYYAPPNTKRLRKGGGVVMDGVEMSMWRKNVRTFGELSKLYWLNDADWIHEKIDRKKFPTLLEQQQFVTVHKEEHHLRETNTSFLDAIKRDLEDDITGSVPFTGLNFMHLLWLFNDLFRKMYEETEDHPTSQEHPLPAHGKWMDTVLYLALYPYLKDDQAGKPIKSDLLKCMGEIFEREMDGVELKDFVYFDERRDRVGERPDEDEDPGWRDFERFITRGGFYKNDIEKF